MSRCWQQPNLLTWLHNNTNCKLIWVGQLRFLPYPLSSTESFGCLSSYRRFWFFPSFVLVWTIFVLFTFRSSFILVCIQILKTRNVYFVCTGHFHSFLSSLILGCSYFWRFLLFGAIVFAVVTFIFMLLLRFAFSERVCLFIWPIYRCLFNVERNCNFLSLYFRMLINFLMYHTISMLFSDVI